MDHIPLPTRKPPRLSVTHFVVLMIVVVAVQGTYLGYTVGMLTTLERRFGISSEKSGLLLSLYDIGHTVSILVIGYFAAHAHLPRITGVGVLLSALSMFLLSLPVLLFGTATHDLVELQSDRDLYVSESRCDSWRSNHMSEDHCREEHEEHTLAYVLLSLGQILAGVCAAPFNTLAYVYIDSNVADRRQSPFLLGLLTSMYAFGPALGFALSSGLTRVYTTLGDAPAHISINSDEWVGAWWLGFIICGFLYLLSAPLFFLFPRSYKYPEHEMQPLNQDHKPHLPPAEFHDSRTAWEKFVAQCKEFPLVVYDLICNPVFVSMVVAWMFGSYLIGGYSTYLPKYIETQYGRSASAADFYSGIISVGSIAVSTALGGWILTHWNISPRRAMLCLALSWCLIVVTYLIGLSVGCEQPRVNGLHYQEVSQKWSFYDAYHQDDCAAACHCQSVTRFDPVNFDGTNFFSPCHAGCESYDRESDTWLNCECAMGGVVERGVVHPPCEMMFIYLALMYGGLFVGNLFFMVTMMIVLRSVYDDQKVMALSLASCITNLFGFIPAPVLFGWIIDSACILWHSRCPDDPGNCVVYDNDSFRWKFHVSNAGLQALAVVSVLICWLVCRKRQLPEEEDGEYVNEEREDVYE